MKNLRIIEIAEAATEKCVVGDQLDMALFAQTFGEMLVRECATLAYDGPGGILDHFGLE
jgi:hypothetical protein